MSSWPSGLIMAYGIFQHASSILLSLMYIFSAHCFSCGTYCIKCLTLSLPLQLEAKGTVKSEPGDTVRREREEERRLLADTHTAAMDLRCRLEHSERDWVREKNELLERFDVERKEWESQLRDMQHKIEEVSLQMETKPRKPTATPQKSSKEQSVLFFYWFLLLFLFSS